MYLDSYILKTGPGVSYGSTTLKSLQNDNIPELDLLVREAIQNSSDASLSVDGEYYNVSFSTGSFVPSEFNDVMTGIEDILNERYHDNSATYLEIRDTGTTGLTGYIHLKDIYENKDDHGNFFKLIYDTGKNQTQSNAGGNWGFGKSVYYRIGIGIVVYYSRIKCVEGYEDRLIITLIEKENKKDLEGNDITILNSIEPASAGKAWWGSKSEDAEDDRILLPLMDAELIQSILDIFSIKPFKEGETGTSIIIPYIDQEKLLKGIIPDEAEIEEGVRDHLTSVWTSSITDYLKLAIQKWYAPKIHNRNLPKFCKNKWLRVSVNNSSISRQNMLPFFRLTQELYTSAIAKTYSHDYVSEEFPEIGVLPINVQSYFESGMTAGYVALIKISKQKMNGNENVLSPYDYIGKYEADGGQNEPIVMCARDPGMVIDYSITGDWVKGLASPDSPDDFLFGFFVPDTNKEIKKDFRIKEYAKMKLGAYLRECEASDHMDWNDLVSMEIVKRIRRNTINAIKMQINRSNPIVIDATTSKLSNKLGKNLLPKIGYAKQSFSGGGSGGSGGGTRLTDLNFDFTSSIIGKNEIELDYELKFMHGKKKAGFSMVIASEAGMIESKTWNEEIGTSFPVGINSCRVNTIKMPVSGTETEVFKECDINNLVIETSEIKVTLIKEIPGSTPFTRLLFETKLLNPIITGKIRLKTSDKTYRFSFRVD